MTKKVDVRPESFTDPLVLTAVSGRTLLNRFTPLHATVIIVPANLPIREKSE